MKLNLFICLTLFFIGIARPATADVNVALRAFETGEYAQALAELVADEGADVAALRARIMLADAMTIDAYEPPAWLISDAETAAEQALAIDPNNVEGRLQKAIALSLQARAMTLKAARKSGHVEQAKALVEGVLRDDPTNKYAHGYLSVWNLEVLRRGGRLGGMIMGASRKEAQAHYQRAVAVDSDDASVHWQYARALAALNLNRYEDDVRAALTAALASTCETQLEQVMQTRAEALLDQLNDQGIEMAEASARKML